MPTLVEVEHEQLKVQIEKLAEKMELLDHELEPDAVAGMLRLLNEGFSAESIAEEYDLEDRGGA